MTGQPTHMRAMQLIGHGGPEALRYREDMLVPEPGAGEVLVRVRAAGLNNTDINTRIGWYSKADADASDASWAGAALSFPRIQGADICGEVVALGQGVATSLLGKRVLVEPCLREARGHALESPWFIGSECDGGFADYVTVAARHAFPIDSRLSDVELATFPCSYATAENMLTRAKEVAGDTVLITGASGGVGSGAVQLAKARGAHVIAVAHHSKHDALKQIGADKLIPRDENLLAMLEESSVDVVLDLVGGDQWPELLDVLRKFGRYAVAGAIAGPIVELDLRTLYLKDQSFFGCTELDSDVFARLVALIERETLTPMVSGTYALRELSAAQAVFLAKQFSGKLVIDMAL